MAKVTYVELKPDDPIFSEGWSVHSAPPRPAMSAEEMADQYRLQRELEEALRRVDGEKASARHRRTR